MHDQTGAGVDLDHRSALLLEGLTDVVRDQVDAGHVEPDRARGEHALLRGVRVQAIGFVDREIAVVAHGDRASGFGHRVGRRALAHQQVERDGIEHEGGERLGCVFTAQRVAISDHHQLFDGVRAVTGERLRLPTAGRYGLVSDDQHAMLPARNAALDDHPGGDEFLLRDGERSEHRCAILELDRHAAAFVAALRLDDHRQAQLLSRRPGVFGVGHDAASGHRDAHRSEQLARELFVVRNALRDRARAVRLGGPDPALRFAVAELHQVAIGQAEGGNVALPRAIDDGLRARAVAVVVGQLPQLGERRRHDRAPPSETDRLGLARRRTASRRPVRWCGVRR